jgi:hypothetical protein
MTVKSSLVFILLFASSSVFAAEDLDSGNFMLRYCKNLVDGKPPGVWEGQCGGTIDTIVWVRTSLPERDKFCPPTDIPKFQGYRVVVHWLETHPQLLHMNFKGLAWSALKETWPCPIK